MPVLRREQAGPCAGGGSHPEWEAFVQTHLGWVYAYILRRVRHQADAEDLTAEVFLRAWRWVAPERPEREVGAWLTRTCRTVIADHWRSVARDRALRTELAALPARRAPDAGRSHHLVAALLSRLPSRYRTVLELRFLEALPVAEVARRMRIGAGNVRILQYRALRAAAALGLEGGPEHGAP